MRFLPKPHIKIKVLANSQPEFADATSTWFALSPERGEPRLVLQPYAAQRLDTGETLDTDPWGLEESKMTDPLEKQLKARGVRIFRLRFDGAKYGKRAAGHTGPESPAAQDDLASRKESLLAALTPGFIQKRAGTAIASDAVARRKIMEDAVGPLLDKSRDRRSMALDLYNTIVSAGSIRLMFPAGERVVPLDVELSLDVA